MKTSIVHIGLDIDDTHYHGSALDKESGEVITFQSRPTLKGLLNQLDSLSFTWAEFCHINTPHQQFLLQGVNQ
ncbi:MAG: hypothetical protein HRU20_24625 [Pseudomonadales bacterium]|nr:hypothetical protein [Pseudomonadales bacterium]